MSPLLLRSAVGTCPTPGLLHQLRSWNEQTHWTKLSTATDKLHVRKKVNFNHGNLGHTCCSSKSWLVHRHMRLLRLRHLHCRKNLNYKDRRRALARGMVGLIRMCARGHQLHAQSICSFPGHTACHWVLGKGMWMDVMGTTSITFPQSSMIFSHLGCLGWWPRPNCKLHIRDAELLSAQSPRWHHGPLLSKMNTPK